ncbi:FxSxx-COOH system tetratricopeptide repeat protein [Nonomuraea sp. NPDC050783]|uniref:FxSxx-COOH system tetratricopeptide repeat protein n=1 Tax=Nonomuraea sp. NPDC050783 TaxID=3154634 RepID=UPI0034674BFB
MVNDQGKGQIITFYSYKGGTGRTMALANVAWILASNGRRVLAMDWDLESPGLHRFFRPFLDDSVMTEATGIIDIVNEYRWAAVRTDREPPADRHLKYARVEPRAVPLEWTFPRNGGLDFVSAGQQNRDYAALISTFDWDNFYDRFDGGRFLDALRDNIKSAYDYCLIDSRTGLSDIADICTIQMPDVLVDCFTMSDQGIDGAAKVARSICDRHSTREIRILPVPMRVDDGEKKKADAGRSYARARFDGIPKGLPPDERDHYWASLEVPYKRFYAFEETLATFGDPPGHPGSILAAYERLTGAITEGAVTSLPTMEETVRLRWLESFTRKEMVLRQEILLSYAPEDRMWADWITTILRLANFHVNPQPVAALGEGGLRAVEAPHIAIVLSAAYLQDFHPEQWTEDLSAIPGLTVLRVSGDLKLVPPFIDFPTVDLMRLGGPVQAMEAILRSVGKPGHVMDAMVLEGVRFPGGTPKVWNVPPRNASFTGRNKELENLRDQLVSSSQAVLPQALYGLGGVGKTQLALEYAYRFQADYNLIWWVSARADLINPALAELARRLHLPIGDSVVEAAEAALEALRRGDPYNRWLLIFDNADKPEALRSYLPSGPGHIIVTSRNANWSSVATQMEVVVFSREESQEHLLRRVPRLNPMDALQVADELGNLPLAIEQAAAWLSETGQSVASYVEELHRQASQVLSANQPDGYPSTVAATWNASLNQLKQRSPAAERLLQLCAFFSPEPISLSLLYSDETMEVLLPFDESLRGEKLVLGRVIREISRFALARIDQGSNTLQVHRLVQKVIRAHMTPEERDTVSHEVHRILVGARPRQGEVDDPEHWERYDLIWPHLLPSGAETCGEEEVRQLLTERVRYWYKRGEYHSALELGRRLADFWEREFGQMERQRLHLLTNIANVRRSLGQLQEAYELDQWVLVQQRGLLGENHPHTLMTAGGLAADLRALGRYDEGLTHEKRVYESWKEMYGDDHPRTLRAANNLAVSYRLVGDWRNAKDFDDDIYRRMIHVLGPLHPSTLLSAQNLGRSMREAGDLAFSIDLLRQALQHYVDLKFEDYPEALRAMKSLAVSLRRAGKHEEALLLARNVFERYERLYPSDPEGKAVGLEFACCKWAMNDLIGAKDMTFDVLAWYEELLDRKHPYASAAANNLSIYLRALGDVNEALNLSERAFIGMCDALGRDHPFTLSCSINLANCHADVGDLAGAERIEREALPRLAATLGSHHPDTLACQANLTITVRALGHESEAEAAREETLMSVSAKLGDDHPCTKALRAWERVSRDVEPQTA